MTTLNLAVTASGDDFYRGDPSTFVTTGASGFVGQSGTDQLAVGFRFLNVTIPPGAVVTSATLDVEAQAGGGTLASVRTQIRGEAADNATAVTSHADFVARARTAKVDFDPTGSWTAGSEKLIDVTVPVAAVLGRAGWASGNALSLFWENDATSGNHYIGVALFDHATAQEPRLTIVYTVPIAESGGSTVTVTVAASGAGVGVDLHFVGGSTVTVEVEAEGSGTVAYDLPAFRPGVSWRGRLTLIAEVGRRGAPVGESEWDLSLWDTAEWSGLEPVWAVLDNCEISGLSVNRGRLAGTDRFATSTATARLTFTFDRVAWSFREAGPLAVGDEIRFSVGVDLESPISAAGPFPIWRGLIRDVTDDWKPGYKRLDVSIAAVDRMADLAAVTIPPLPSPVGAGETTGERLARIMEAAEIDPFYVDLDLGVATVQATDLSRNLLDEAQITTEAEGTGQFFVSRDGLLTFLDRDWRTIRPRSTSTVVLWSNDAPDPAVPEICPTDFATGRNQDQLANQVSRARAGGTVYTVRDETSIVVYGLRTNQRLDMICDNDPDVEYAADAYLAQRSQRINQIGPLTAVIDPTSPASAIAALVDVDLLDQHEIRWDDGSGLAPYSETFHVQSVAHTVTPDRWTIRVGVWAYND